MGDVSADGLVNIFNLVIVTGNFGQAAVAAASYMLAEVELSTDQECHITHAIDQLKPNQNLSTAEETVRNALKVI